MFTKRRPVPSARTVRLLYQLGYICSGTAFGLVTLCLEEQRRRIQILQKISDNAKVIRQHPRYKGNIALALQAEDEHENATIGSGWTLEGLDRRRKRWEQGSGKGNEDAAQDSALPSVVEREYSELFGNRKTGSSRLVATQPSQPDSLSVLETSSQTSLPGRRSIEKASRKDRENLRTVINIEDFSDTRAGGRDPKLDDARHITRRESHPSDLVLTRESRSHVSAKVERSDEVNTRDERSTASSDLRKLDDVPAGLGTSPSGTVESLPEISRQNLSYQIDRFFTTAANGGLTKNQTTMYAIHAKLFGSAVGVGSLEEFQSLYRWKLRHGSLRQRELLPICYRVGERFGPDELNNFFVELHESKSFSKFPINLALKVVGCLLDLNTDAKIYSFQRTVFEDMLPSVEEDALRLALSSACETFINEGHIHAATKLFFSIVESQNRSIPWIGSGNAILDAAIADRHLENAAALLRRKSETTNIWQSKQRLCQTSEQINSFVELCGQQKAYGLLVDLFDRKSGLQYSETRFFELLTPSNRAVLAVAHSTNTQLRVSFNIFYRSLPRSFRRNVDELAAALSLKASWQATGNLEDVEKLRLRLMEKLKETRSENTLRELDEAMIEIYVSANRMDNAHSMISTMHETIGASHIVMCQTALMFAKKGSWKYFTRLFDMLKRMKSFHFDDETGRVFNAVIRVFCQHHSANEAWDLINTAVRDLGFTPSRATSEILLQSFIQHKEVNLITKWIDFLKSIGCDNTFDSRMIVVLLRRYYVDHRPSHIVLMWLCRRLTVLSPSFVSKDLVGLVEQAIGYDLRHLYGKYARWQQEHAEARLERVQASKPFIPSPGFVRNQQLFFPDSELDVRDLLQTKQLGEEAPEPLDEPFYTISAEEVDDITDDTPEISSVVEDDTENLEAPSEDDGSLTSQSGIRYDIDFQGRKKTEGHMWLHMSRGEYQSVLDLYYGSLDAAGCPASSDILEIALDASLRFHNDRSNADEMIHQAQEAGMDTTSAVAPLLIHQLQRYDLNAEINVASLRAAVLSYYRSNNQNGRAIRPYLATKAAHFLMFHRRTSEGLDLLSSIYFSTWAKVLPLNHVAMTVFLKGYITLQDLQGIEWVVEAVLTQDIRITQKFMTQLKFLTRGDFKWMGKLSSQVHPLLVSWVARCAERRRQQIEETHSLGWSLVRILAESSPSASNIDIYTPVYLQGDSFAEDIPSTWDAKDQDFIDESYYSDEATNESEETKRFAEMQRRMVENWRAEREFRGRLTTAARAQGARDKFSPLRIPDASSEKSGEVLEDISEFEGEADNYVEGDEVERTSTTFKPFP